MRLQVLHVFLQKLLENFSRGLRRKKTPIGSPFNYFPKVSPEIPTEISKITPGIYLRNTSGTSPQIPSSVIFVFRVNARTI